MKLTNKRLEKILGYGGVAAGIGLMTMGFAQANHQYIDYGAAVCLGSCAYTIIQV